MTRLSKLGELGLLAELEQRGLIVDVKDDAAQLGGGLIVTQDAIVENVHFRLDWIGWRELGWRAAAASLSDLAASGAEPEALVISLAVPAETDAADVIELYEGIAETGVPVVGGDLTSSDAVVLSVTALGRSERVPGRGGARPATCSSSPARSGGRVRRFASGRTSAFPCASPRDGSSRRLRMRCSTSRTGSRSTPPTWRAGREFAASSSCAACRSHRVRPSPTSPTARTTSCSPLSGSAGGFPVIGHVEEGEGVELLLDGSPHVLRGWEHFA